MGSLDDIDRREERTGASWDALRSMKERVLVAAVADTAAPRKVTLSDFAERK